MRYEILDRLPVVQTGGRHVYIWGTGNTSICYQEGFARENWLEIYGYGVNDESQYGGVFRGKRIFSAEEIAEDKDALVLICTLQPWVYEQVSTQMRKLGIEAYYADAVILGRNQDKIRSVIEMLEDDRSVETYLHILACRAACRYPDMRYIEDRPYGALPEFRLLDKNDVMIDCGAFVGDTIEKFVWDHLGMFERIIGFEPDPRNYAAMSRRAERLKAEWALAKDAIKLYPCGVSDASSVAYVGVSSGGNPGSYIIPSDCDGNEEESGACRIVAIDDVVRTRYSFLKADIEGWEYKMLLGASESMKTWHPRLGICIYHNATDLYSIPLLVRSICPDYHLAIRHHTAQLFDTVLYAW